MRVLLSVLIGLAAGVLLYVIREADTNGAVWLVVFASLIVLARRT